MADDGWRAGGIPFAAEVPAIGLPSTSIPPSSQGPSGAGKVDRVNRPEILRSPDSPRSAPLVTAVIVNFNAWPDVSALVGELARSPEVEDGLCEVVVVDNASDGPVPPAFGALPRGVRLI